ncbi:unnamed protein product [Chilo suppressalis]|uniref:Uncharacterized protein n=1 Tax=Chilo suppressalis TaxID=168631 RepID=A0ABN8L768_CHISP|nr:unnamed protein product [Chilo suppressalis]
MSWSLRFHNPRIPSNLNRYWFSECTRIFISRFWSLNKNKTNRVKNSDCNSTVTQDIKKYRNEINLLSKKIETLISVVSRLSLNVELLENQVEKAEHDFGVNNDSKLKNLFKPFLKKKEPMLTKNALVVPDKLKLETVLDNFENLDS